MSLPNYIERIPLRDEWFNPGVNLPYALTLGEIRATMEDAHNFVYLLNGLLVEHLERRIEDILMPATFSGMLSEFLVKAIPDHTTHLTRNLYHNGHPDLIPAGMFPGNAVQYAHEGLEVKCSSYPSGWQGHNPERIWVIVFRYDFDPYRPEKDPRPIEEHRPFEIVEVLIAELQEGDWSEQGRGRGSRRTPTASIIASGTAKLRRNWVYRNPAYKVHGFDYGDAS
jgi:hypothetical protein